jgi:hypothetical protein
MHLGTPVARLGRIRVEWVRLGIEPATAKDQGAIGYVSNC